MKNINILIRGIPVMIYRKIQKKAEEKDLSINQMLNRFIVDAMEGEEKKREQEEQRREAYHRIKQLQAEMGRKYGTFDDSTKIIREMRDTRGSQW